MEKVRHDRRKDVHTRLDFREGPRERIREDSYYSNTMDRVTELGRVKVQDRLKYGNRHVLDRLGHRRQSAFDWLSETYSPSTTKSRHQKMDSRNFPRGRSRTRSLSASRDGRHKDRECLCSTRECSRKTQMPNNVKTYDGTGDPKDHVKVFQAAAQKKYVKDPVEIYNIKQRDGETIEDFTERLKIETGRMKGALECMRISGFMHEVNNLELTKRLNEHVPKTMEEMMITTTAFIRGEAMVASKKKGHVSWKPQDQSKRHSADKKSNFQDYSREGRKPNRFTPLTRRSKEILATEASHCIDECMQLKKQIEELVRAGKLSHLIKEIKQGRDQSKEGKKETAVKDKPTTIYMVQSWQRTVKQKVTQSFKRVGEIVFPKLAASNGTEGPLVIEAEMGGHIIHRMYIDDTTTSLTGFNDETIWPLGQLRLLVTIGDAAHSTRAWMNFMVVKSMSPYNVIIGRPGLKAIHVVPSTVYGMLKFPVEGGITTIRNTILIPTEFASVTTSPVIPGEEKSRPTNFTVALHPDFLEQEEPSDMTGVPRSVAEHRLTIREGYSLVRQKKRGQAHERAKAIQAEVQNLVDARIMREIYYDWLSNPVMVKKHDGSWRMCVDFTDLNQACPQDCYPLPEIDWKVESLCGYPFKCFLDAYKGYHQIQLVEADEEKTAFHTGQGVYCYTKMPFGLKTLAPHTSD
nr:hypothetical protein [Tanacetum cinerariifolium]